MKWTFLLKPNLFLSKRTRAAVVKTITITITFYAWAFAWDCVLQCKRNAFCALGWMSCASTPNDVIRSLLPSPKLFITSPFLKSCLQNWSLQIGSSPFLFFLPGLCYHSSIIRNISSLLFQLTSSQLTVPINQLLDRLLIVSSRDDNTVSMFVLVLIKEDNLKCLFGVPAEYRAQIERVTERYDYAVGRERITPSSFRKITWLLRTRREIREFNMRNNDFSGNDDATNQWFDWLNEEK